MPRYISVEKRKDIIFHKQNRKSSKEIAEFMRVTIRKVDQIWAEYRKTGKCELKIKNCGRKSVITSEQKEKIINQINSTPDITLNELIDMYGLNITEGGMSKYLKAMGYTFKKRQLILQNKTEKM